MPTARQLVEELEKLSPDERLQVIDQVIHDTIEPHPEIESIWVREASARWEAFERGDVTVRSYRDVMEKYRT
ncbi:addiction module antitoxin RelB [Geothermobacter hydrogeniphilus]|uniref:Addiction module antitoxin RelB n=1 Tax=Geothermobacter hydrogeniphilus TaxID=1969733 RepID=A0A2K2H5U7_9BACT|nr:addiction module protein [Geothermobacter hydrogeniphilus]PNU18692.1 addiction module antitoxin RelB [Geothermobacter hydrogeniphilus]